MDRIVQSYNISDIFKRRIFQYILTIFDTVLTIGDFPNCASQKCHITNIICQTF